jgi:hypothetical protein
MSYQSIYAKVQAGAYKVKAPYPNRNDYPKKPVIDSGSEFYEQVMEEYETKMAEYKALKEVYNKDLAERESAFYNDCIQLLVESGATKKQAGKAYSIAWEHGHAYGYSEVLSHVHDLCYIWSED